MLTGKRSYLRNAVEQGAPSSAATVAAGCVSLGTSPQVSGHRGGLAWLRFAQRLRRQPAELPSAEIDSPLTICPP